MYTPAKTRAYEAKVAACALKAGVRIEPGLGVLVVITAVMRRPAKPSQPFTDEGRAWCTTKPDIDNIAKAVIDGLVLGRVIADDNAVVHASLGKVYAAVGEEPQVMITISSVEPYTQGEKND